MRPSMMTLVSRILWFVADVRFAAENAAERAEVQQFAFGRARDRAKVDEQQQTHDLDEVQRRRSYRTQRPEHHADQRRADQPGD